MTRPPVEHNKVSVKWVQLQLHLRLSSLLHCNVKSE